MEQQPTGTVTFLFTDIEGSTRLWERDPAAMSVALARHNELVQEAIVGHEGYIFNTVGDGVLAAFADGRLAIRAAIAAQRALYSEPWPEGAPIRVRIALHTGQAEARSGDYVGTPLNHCARIIEAAHGGQTLLSETAREVVGDALPDGAGLLDLGAHRLRDLARAERIYQLTHTELPVEFPPLKSLDRLPNNLPIRRSRFIGREREIQEITHLLDGTALLTLTGAGGSGKTRLALQVAASVADDYADGVWFADLGPLNDPELVPQRVAVALGLRDEPGRTLVETLIEYLRPRSLLLLLDNCEHLVDSTAKLAQELLEVSSGLKILATSREPLGIEAELAWRIPGLGIPPRDVLASADSDDLAAEAARYEAVRLFEERARAVAPGFTLTDENAAAVAEVCRRLDGMPLAIELASARMKVLSAQQILERLDDQLQLLTDGPRSAVPRQQTLRALIDWSYQILTEREKAVLRRLSVFRGGWPVEGAEAVCAAGEVRRFDVLDHLTALVAKSMVKVTERGGAARHALQETMQQYAWQKLVDAEEATATLDRQLAWCAELAERAEPELAGQDQAEWQARLDLEHDNMRAALEWATGDDRAPHRVDRPVEAADIALRLVAALYRYWELRGHLREGRQWMHRALALPGAEELAFQRARVLAGAGLLAWQQGDYAEAGALSEESLTIAQQKGDSRTIAVALGNLATVAQHQGDYAAARSYNEESLATWEILGDRWGIAGALNSLGSQAWEQGEYEWAAEFYEEGLALRRELGDLRGVANSLDSLATVASARGDHATARALYDEALGIARQIGDRRGIAYILDNLGRLAHERGDPEAAADLLASSLEMKRDMGDPRGTASSLHALGEVARFRADHDAACDLFHESLAIRRGLGDLGGIAETLEGFAALADEQDEPLRAVWLYSAASSLRDLSGTAALPVSRSETEERLGRLRDAVGADAYAAAWRSGANADWRNAVAVALGDADPPWSK